jgi:hypothetical protein
MDISNALLLLAPGASWSINADDYNQITWNSPDIPKPTEEEVVQKVVELTYQKEVEVYKEQRATEYPPYADQFDQIFHEGIDAWKATILEVKRKYPKQVMQPEVLEERKRKALEDLNGE